MPKLHDTVLNWSLSVWRRSSSPAVPSMRREGMANLFDLSGTQTQESRAFVELLSRMTGAPVEPLSW